MITYSQIEMQLLKVASNIIIRHFELKQATSILLPPLLMILLLVAFLEVKAKVKTNNSPHLYF